MEDIAKCAITIKKYCESQPTCQKCQFKEENGTEHMCALYGCPNEWEVNYYPSGTGVVVGKTNKETRTCPEGGNMNGNIKLIIEIPTDLYEITKAKVDKNMTDAPLSVSIANGIPLDNDSERAETQAYFAGEAYGWEQGRKALIDDVKAEFINRYPKNFAGELELGGYACAFSLNKVLKILDNIGKESEK